MNWSSRDRRWKMYEDYDDNDISDAFQDITQSPKANRLRKILWIELLVVTLIAVIILLIP